MPPAASAGRTPRAWAGLALALLAGCAAAPPAPPPSAPVPESGNTVCHCPPAGNAAQSAQVQGSGFALACSCQPPSTPRVTVAQAPPPPPAASPAVPPSVTVYFEYRSAALSAEARAALDRWTARAGALAPGASVSIDGHADFIASAKYNLRLSAKRAASVKDYLVSRGIDAARIDTHAHGATEPVKRCAERHRPALIRCLAPNRRAYVHVVGASG